MTAPLEPRPVVYRGKPRSVLVMEPGLMALFADLDPRHVLIGPVEWLEVEEVLRKSAPATVVVVDPYAGPRRGERFPRVRHLLRRFPSVPVVAAMELRPEVTGDVATLLEWGVSEVVAVGPESTPGAMAARLRLAHARPFKRRLGSVLSTYVSTEARAIVMAAAEVAVDGGQAPELAHRLGIGPRTLTVRCARAELPPPRQVQAWMRLLLACLLLDDPGRTVQGAALAAGYSTDKSLRRAITTLLGVDSTTLRSRGAFDTAGPAFDTLLRDAREAAHERRR